MSGPEFNPADEEPIDREEWEKFMTTNSKPQFVLVTSSNHSRAILCIAPLHSQADKHKRVAERISKALHWGEYTRREVERILREVVKEYF